MEADLKRFLSIPQGVYLQLLAKTVYFLPTEDPILVTVQSYQKRLWLRYKPALISSVASS
jgi:hypothetical protein